MVYQSEESECGLACLSMVLGYFGQNFSIKKMRAFADCSRGISFKRLSDIASKLGLIGRGLRVNIDSLHKISQPTILHWNKKHFVVLKKITSKYVIIHDPSEGVCKIDIDIAKELYSGVALEFIASSNFKSNEQNTDETDERIDIFSTFRNIKGIFRPLGLTFALSIFIQIVVLTSPILTQMLLDEVIPSEDLDLLIVLSIVFATFFALKAVSDYARKIILAKLGTIINFELGTKIFHYLMMLPLKFFQRRTVGSIMVKFRSIENIKRILSSGIATGLIDGLIAIFTIIVMIYYSKLLAIAVIVSTMVIVFVQYLLFSKMKNETYNAISAASKQTNIFVRTIKNILPIKLHNRQSLFRGDWQDKFALELIARLKLENIGYSFELIRELIQISTLIIVIYIGVNLVFDEHLTVGMFLAFLAYRELFNQSASGLINTLIEFKMLRVHFEQIGDILLEEDESEENKLLNGLELIGAIECKGVSYNYPDTNIPVLDDVSLSVKCGETIVIIGPSGSGKSTLLNILMGNISPSIGTVSYDGFNLNVVSRVALRNHIAFLHQDDQIYPGTILENISFFDENPKLQDVAAAAYTANILDEIQLMPLNFLTELGEMDAGISSGQKQRILLARALYKKPKILFMDEATSNLDSANSDKINLALNSLGITKIIITHRTDVKTHCDRILQLKEGKLHHV
jgi:ATP-binding cassette subfamily B protein RaxB